ncbi:MAG TPA: ATPase, T2SS/T4P/T4SS family [Polyangiaceae bacterium]|jgi:pilus assembly protein CpaF|nr:ATPase, T2SS/T4P/T4SS family [Polyangiaceae bacterium]
MFTIIISEKGGAERRETFDRNEINVGRVQGNDLMLPKGNVSKHHARLLYRDGRFIVTDLKSTNGTYVNGRKISQATIVREGDKIYIGDFVVRLEASHASGVAAVGAPDGDDSQARIGRINPHVRDVPSPAPGERAPLPSSPSSPSSPGAVPAAASSTPMSPQRSVESAVSHFPLERDPDSESAPDLQGVAAARVPGPPRLPDADVRRTTSLGVAPAPPPLPRARSMPQQTARRRALIALIDRVADAVDLSPLDASPVVDDGLTQRVDAAVNEQSRAMREEGEAPEGVDHEELGRDALRELLGLGPLGVLLEDDQADEVFVPRPDVVLAMHGGQPSVVEPSFTSQQALARVVARLAYHSGEPLLPGEAIIDRRLARGARMIAVAPPVASAWTLAIRKQVRAEGTLDDLVRGGALSRPMAALLEACVVARANLLVVGTGAGQVAPMVAALAFAAAPGERIAVLADSDDIQVGHAHVTRLALADRGARGEEALWAAARLRPDRLVIATLAGPVAAAVIDAVSDGSEGVIAGLSAPSLRQALARLAAQVALARPGASIESAREAAAECFDLAVEVARGSDGRVRVARMGELAGVDAAGIVVRDIFIRSADGTGESGFAPTGVSPRFVQDFAARGVRLDASLFRRR